MNWLTSVFLDTKPHCSWKSLRVRGTSFKRICPLVAPCPEEILWPMMSIRAFFPEPFDPKTAMTSPECSSNETSLRMSPLATDPVTLDQHDTEVWDLCATVIFSVYSRSDNVSVFTKQQAFLLSSIGSRVYIIYHTIVSSHNTSCQCNSIILVFRPPRELPFNLPTEASTTLLLTLLFSSRSSLYRGPMFVLTSAMTSLPFFMLSMAAAGCLSYWLWVRDQTLFGSRDGSSSAVLFGPSIPLNNNTS